MLQAQSGYIWLATYGGLVRFDGDKFTTFNASNTKGLDFDRILNLFEGARGDLWVLPEEIEPIILHFKDGEIEPHIFPEISRTELVIYVSNGETWLTGSGKIYKFINNKFTEVPTQSINNLANKFTVNKNAVWMFEGNKIYQSAEDSVIIYHELPDAEGWILDMIEYPKGSGTYFIGTYNNLMIRFENGKETIVQEGSELPAGKFLRYYTDGENLFAIMGGNLLLWNGQKFEHFTFNADLPENLFIEDLIADYEGNYWVGTEGDGLFKLRPTIISMIDKRHGLQNEKMLSLTSLDNGKMLFSTNCGGVYEWENGKATLSTLHKYLDAVCNWSVYEDSKNNLWLGDAKLYVTKSLDKPGKFFDTEDGFNTIGVRGILEDKEGDIWVATNFGVYKYDGTKFENFATADGLNNNYIITLYEDKSGAIWVGSMYGVNKISNNEVIKIDLLHDVNDTSIYSQPYIRAFFEDESGAMWIGSYGYGLYKFKDGHVDNITTEQGLFDNVVSHIVMDEQENFWMGSNRGISRVNRNELNQYFDGNIEQVKSYSYGVTEGMNSAETNGGFSPSTITDSLGNIYFPTVQGVAVVSTRQIKTNNIPPPVYIENLRNVEGEIANTKVITIPYNNPFLEIEYTAVSFSAPKKVNYKYRMIGLDNSWLDVGNRSVAMYSIIPPGKYTFQVIASNNDGVWNTTGASINIEVIAPFWQKNWFIALVSFLFFATVGLGVYYRILFLKKENEKQRRFSQQLIESQEQERRRIASDLHDGLGQQILVIKNRVELAQNNIENAKNLNQELNKIRESAITSIQEVRTISHGLRPVHLERFGLTEAIRNLCQQLDETSNIGWSYHIDDIDGVIPKDKEINFYRVLQEATKNILNHSSAKTASIAIKRFESEIRAVVSDDGKGFNVKVDRGTDGLGYLGMKERIKTLGGTLDIQSKIGEGVVIKIILPVKQYE